MREVDLRCEFLVWQCARDHFGDGMRDVLAEAVRCYRRRPGFDQLVRLYASQIGSANTGTLAEVLFQHDLAQQDQSQSYVSLRTHLKDHLRNFLQRHLIEAGVASEILLEDRLARDVNL
jgi:hypothetical protein